MERKVYIEAPRFTGRNVPIAEIAKAIGKDAQYIRVGLQQGVLNFGYAMKMGGSREYSYYAHTDENSGKFEKQRSNKV